MNKQIEKLAEELLFYTIIPNDDLCEEVAEYIITAGYRRQDEVAREIFAEIKKILNKTYFEYISGEIDLSDDEKKAVLHFHNDIVYYFRKLKKKYIGEQE